MIAPMPLIPSQSATPRSPGLPARASRFSVRSPNDELVTRDNGPGHAGGQRAQGPLEERLLQLELLEVLGLHRAELGQASLDRVDRRPPARPKKIRRIGGGRDGGDEDGKDGHRLRPRCRRSCGWP